MKNSRWIKFDEADKATHPKDCTDVFVLNHYGIVQTACFESEQFLFGDAKLDVQPEYWMLIDYPKPPMSEQEIYDELLSDCGLSDFGGEISYIETGEMVETPHDLTTIEGLIKFRKGLPRWWDFDINEPLSHPEHYRTCQLVSDSIKWEDEAFYAFDGEFWFTHGPTNYSLDPSYLQGLKWHYLKPPPKPE